jgi:hypothetical protein
VWRETHEHYTTLIFGETVMNIMGSGMASCLFHVTSFMVSYRLLHECVSFLGGFVA